jgi:hypothetical protein
MPPSSPLPEARRERKTASDEPPTVWWWRMSQQPARFAWIGRRLRSLTQTRERGALSLMIVALAVGLVAVAGIVVDGGAKLIADENAVAVAQEAARAGATTVNVSDAYSAGVYVVDQQRALQAARAYLAKAGFRHYSVGAAGFRAIRVTVTITEPTKFLALIGIGSFTCTGVATATLVTAVAGGT